MKRTITAIFIAAAALCACTGPAAEERAALIPQPCEIDYQAGSFTLPEGLEIAVASRELAPQAGYLTEALAKYTDASISEGTSGDVVLAIDPAMETEEYTLDVRRSGIRISGGSCRGVVNGIATLRQLLPAGAGEKAEVPCVKVSDRPAFGWRGAMLDVSRHFFDKGEIFRMLDQMAVLKLNKFHWHLTDDQGWRIEIKKYPDLTEKGGWRHFNKHDRICMERAEQQLNDDYLIPENDTSENSFSLLLDTRWTDLFWPYRSAEYHIDEIYLNFLNRFFLNWYIARCNTDATPKEVTARDFYKQLSAAINGKNKDYRYQSISIYNQVLTRECIASLQTCLNRLCDLYQNVEGGDNKQKLQAIDALFMPYWEEFAENGESDKANKIFSFIPRYAADDNTNTPVPITLKQQVVFHAICVYLTNCEKVETESLKDWMHFVWNMAENSDLDSGEQSVDAIRFFDTELNKLPKLENNEAPDQASDNIIDYLAGIDEGQIKQIKKLFGRRQLLEEIAKAKQIKQDPDWKNIIHEAEKAAFFKGAIAFLFNNEKGETDWSNFDTKSRKAQKLFDKDGVKADKTVVAMQTLYSYCDDWDSQFWWNAKIFNGKANTWKDQILTKVIGDNKYVYAEPIHYLLMKAEPSKERKVDRRLRLLSSKSLIEHLVKENAQGLDMYIRDPHDALHYCGRKYGVMLSYPERDKCLNELLRNNKIKLVADWNEDKYIEKDEYGDEDVVFWGNLDINFTYRPENGKPIHLQWYRGRSSTEYDIYLMNEDWTYKIRPTPLEDEKGDRKRLYCFNLHIDESSGKSLADQFCKQVETEFAEFIK